MVSKERRALDLYTRGLKLQEIADELGVSLSTIEGYKRKSKGGENDWDAVKARRDLSPLGLRDMYFDLVKKTIERAEKDAGFRDSAAFADSMAKHMTTLKKLDPSVLNKGLIHDFIKITDKHLAEVNADLRRKLTPYWEGIRCELLSLFDRKSVL